MNGRDPVSSQNAISVSKPTVAPTISPLSADLRRREGKSDILPASGLAGKRTRSEVQSSPPRAGGADVTFDAIDLDAMSFGERYKVLSGTVLPRPIALVSSTDAADRVNVAPFSSFMIASVEAGYLAFSIGPSEWPKTTLVNIRGNRQYVINAVCEDMAVQVQECGADGVANPDKIKRAKFHLIPSVEVVVPRVAESPIQFECRLKRMIRFGDSHMVVGRILRMHARPGLICDAKVDLTRYAPLGRIAGRKYCLVRDIISV